MSDVLIEPKVVEPSTDEPLVAHIVKKDDTMRGYVNGEAIEALCGARIIPSRNPNRYPVCEPCKVVFRRLTNRGSN